MTVAGHDSGPGPAMPFDLMPTATALVDGTLAVAGWSRAARELLGYRAAEVLGRPATDLLARPARPPQLGPGESGTVVLARHRDGRVLTLGLHASALAAPGGRTAWALSAIDLATAPWWRASHSVLEHFLSHSPYGIAVLDTDLRYVWTNHTLERMAGVPLTDRVGRRMSEVMPDLPHSELDAVMRRVLATGEPVLDFEYRGRVPADPGREHAFSASYLRLHDERQRVLGVCYMGIDITDRWRTRERLTLLTESGGRIGSALDFATTARELAEVAVEHLADFAAVDLLETVLDGAELAPWDPAASLRRVAHRSADPGRLAAVTTPGERPAYHPDSPMARALTEGKPVMENALARYPGWLAADPPRQAAFGSGAATSVMAIPLRARGAVLGVTVLLRREPFEPDDLALAGELGARAAVCLDNARRYTREHRTALALQRSLLPPTLPHSPTLELAHRYLPAAAPGDVGGKWFDVIQLSGARTALVVGEVAGRGIDAAAAMGRLRTAVHTLADLDLPPDELLAHLDDLVLRLVEEHDHDPLGRGTAAAAQGATCLYVVHDPVTGRCTLASAGHPGPAVVTPDGVPADVPPVPQGPPLGAGTLPFEAVTYDLPPGTRLALGTRSLAGRPGAAADGLAAALAGADPSVERACDRVLGTMLPPVPREDVALLVARTLAVEPDRVATWELPSDPTVVAEARSMTVGKLADWGLDELAFTTELAVSELVTNAIRYGRGPVALRLINQDALICEVFDGASSSPRLRHARTTDEGGRGLFMVAQLTRRWGTRYTDTGKVIWCEQALPDGS